MRKSTDLKEQYYLESDGQFNLPVSCHTIDMDES